MPGKKSQRSPRLRDIRAFRDSILKRFRPNVDMVTSATALLLVNMAIDYTCGDVSKEDLIRALCETFEVDENIFRRYFIEYNDMEQL